MLATLQGVKHQVRHYVIINSVLRALLCLQSGIDWVAHCIIITSDLLSAHTPSEPAHTCVKSEVWGGLTVLQCSPVST